MGGDLTVNKFLNGAITDGEHSKAWLSEFERDHGRPLRVLHIGNIANNAYLNSKYLRQLGVESDVLCFDYYHMMGCPEWEDADILKYWKDDYYPDWSSSGVEDFKRPSWFVQGPFKLCSKYICAVKDCRKTSAFFLKSFISIYCYVQAKERRVIDLSKKAFAMVRASVVLAKAFLRLLYLGLKSPRKALVFLAVRINSLVPRKVKRLKTVARLAKSVKRSLVSEGDTVPALAGEMVASNSNTAILESFKESFPERMDQLKASDLTAYSSIKIQWDQLLSHYDVVQCYATNPIIALLSDVQPYVAFEHGTIRSIPFEDSPLGRLTALAYKKADAAIITNCDNRLAADRLGLTNETFIPHPINESVLQSDEITKNIEADLRKRLNSDFVILHPSRQHWSEERHPDWEKGNDVFIRGFARFVNEVNPRAGAVFVDWGLKVDESKELLDSLGCADRVIWVKPQPNRAFVRYILATDLVADQFYLGAFGSIPGKAMACGKPVLLNLNEDIHRWCFPEMPPVLNTKTDVEVFGALSKLYQDKVYRSEIEERGIEWYEKFHSSRVVVQRHLEIYQKVLQH